MFRETALRQANNSTTTGGAGPINKPGGAPQLPDVVPDGVQALLDGIFGFGGDMGKAFGDMVSGLADAIQGSGAAAETAQELAPLVVDVAAVVI